MPNSLLHINADKRTASVREAAMPNSLLHINADKRTATVRGVVTSNNPPCKNADKQPLAARTSGLRPCVWKQRPITHCTQPRPNSLRLLTFAGEYIIIGLL